MDSLGRWFAAARPGRALLAPMATTVGAGYAIFDARPGPGLGAYLVAIGGALAAGVGVNFLDHAWDAGGAEAPVAARDAWIAGAAGLALAAASGTLLMKLAGSAAVGYGILGTVLAASRRVPALGLDTLGWGFGELATAAAWGPCAVLSGFATRAGTGSSGAFLAGVPVGLVATQALFARHFTGRDADIRLGRASPLVAVGAAGARRGLVLLPLIAAAAVAIAACVGEYGPWAVSAAAPMIVAASLAWRLPPTAEPEPVARWERAAIVCALASLGCIAASLGIATTG